MSFTWGWGVGWEVGLVGGWGGTLFIALFEEIDYSFHAPLPLNPRSVGLRKRENLAELRLKSRFNRQ